MLKIISHIFIAAAAISVSLASDIAAQNTRPITCNFAYNNLINASRNVEFAANNVSNAHRRIDQNQESIHIRLAQFEQQRQQIELSRETALSFNGNNTGSCFLNTFFFGGRFVNCVPQQIINANNIRNNFNNQLRFLEINRQNYIRFAQQQQVRFAQNAQQQIQFYYLQRQRCQAAVAVAQSCTWPFTNVQPPAYPNVACEAYIAPVVNL